VECLVALESAMIELAVPIELQPAIYAQCHHDTDGFSDLSRGMVRMSEYSQKKYNSISQDTYLMALAACSYILQHNPKITAPSNLIELYDR